MIFLIHFTLGVIYFLFSNGGTGKLVDQERIIQNDFLDTFYFRSYLLCSCAYHHNDSLVLSCNASCCFFSIFN